VDFKFSIYTQVCVRVYVCVRLTEVWRSSAPIIAKRLALANDDDIHVYRHTYSSMRTRMHARTTIKVRKQLKYEPKRQLYLQITLSS